MILAKYLTSIFILLAIDIPFIYFISQKYKQYWPHPLKMDLKTVLSTLAIYFALSTAIIFVALETANPLLSAFIIGSAAYATYAFTVYAIIPDWPLYLVLGESVWGGVLVALTTFILQYVVGHINR